MRTIFARIYPDGCRFGSAIRDALEAKIRRERIREEEVRHAEGYTRKPVEPGEFDVWLNQHD